LINSPKILLADEPTGNLDHTNEMMVLKLFQEHHKQGYTIIMVTHNPEVAEMADRIVHFTHGQITSETNSHILR